MEKFVNNHIKFWRKIHNKKLEELFQRQNIIKYIERLGQDTYGGNSTQY